MNIKQYFTGAILYQENLYFLHNNKLYKKEDNNNILLIDGFNITSFFIYDDSHILFIQNNDIMLLKNNEIKRLTFLSKVVTFAGFDDETNIYFCCNGDIGSKMVYQMYKLSNLINDFQVKKVDIEHCQFIHKSEGNYAVKINGYAYRNWKNYRGGLAGKVLVTDNISDYNNVDYINFNKDEITRMLLTKHNAAYETQDTLKYVTGNISQSYIKNNRLYCCADFYGDRHIYSSDFNGNNIVQHTEGDGSYFNFQMSVDGNFTAVKDGLIYSMSEDVFKLIEIQTIHSSFFNKKNVKINPSFISVNNNGQVNVISRGKSIFASSYKGDAIIESNENYRRSAFLSEDRLLLLKTDARSDFFDLYINDTLYSLTLKNAAGSNFCGDIGYVTNMLGNETHFAFSNHKNELYVVTIVKTDNDVKDKQYYDGHIKLIASSKYNNMKDFSISNNSVVFIQTNFTNNNIINRYDIKTNCTQQLQDDNMSCGSYFFKPKIVNNDKNIVCLHAENFKSSYTDVGFNMEFDKKISIPVCYESLDCSLFDVDKISEDNAEKPSDKIKTDVNSDTLSTDDTKKLTNSEKSEIDEKITYNYHNFIKFPKVPYGNYRDIVYSEKNAYVVSVGGSDKYNIHSFSFEDQSWKEIYSQLDYYSFSGDGKYIVVAQESNFKVLKTGSQISEDDKSYKNNGALSFNNHKITIDMRAEWRFIFDQVVRIHKNLFWRESILKNIDDIASKYTKLIDNIETRDDLNYIIAEFNGELQTSHVYVYNSGDLLNQQTKIDDDSVGFLGAEYEFCNDKKAYKILTIYSSKSPLYQKAVRVGSYIYKINGITVQKNISINEMLKLSSGKATLIEFILSKNLCIEQENLTADVLIDSKKDIDSKVDKDNTNSPVNAKSEYNKKITLTPLKSEDDLKYDFYIKSNKNKIDKYLEKLNNNTKIGYVHISDMSNTGFDRFYPQYLSQRLNDGLIIDVRYNGGGNTSSIIFEKILPKFLGYDKHRYNDAITYPIESPPKHIVLLVNEHTASDGDIFAAAFKKFNLGKVVGQRTWGGVVGINISSINQLLDGGCISSPGYPLFFGDQVKGSINEEQDKEVSEFIENTGVEPDYYIRGGNPQLEKAIDILVGEIGV